MNDTKSLSLENKVEELRGELEEVKEEAREVQEKRQQAENADEAERGEELRERWQSLEEDAASLYERLSALEEALEEWGDVRWTIKELTYGELQHIRDETTDASFDISPGGDVDGVPRDGLYRIKTLEYALTNREQLPEPVPEHPKDLPPELAEWLYDEVTRFNSPGDTEGNFSLERMLNE